MYENTQGANVNPCSTAECEQRFSGMDIMMSPERSTLLLATVSALMYTRTDHQSLCGDQLIT